MKASQLLRGKRAVHRVRLPLCNLRCAILPDLPELAEQREADQQTWEAEHGELPNDDEVWVGVRTMTGLEIADVIERGIAFAKKRGCENPKENEPLYDLGIAVNTLAIACVDVDAKDPDAPEARFFDGGVEQILESPHLGRDGIVYLHEQQELWQDLCSPQAKKLNTEQFEQLLDELAGPESLRFFGMLAPGMRWSFMHSMASLLLSVRTLKSMPSSTTDEGGKTESLPRPQRERSQRQTKKRVSGRRLQRRMTKRGK